MKASKIYLDIETIPSQEPWVRQYVEETISPPKTIKKQESIDKWMAEERPAAIDDAIDKAGFEGATNHIISIGVAVDDNPPVDFSAHDILLEREILVSFYNYLEEKTDRMNRIFIGHNIAGFDLRVIRQRSIIKGVKIPMNIPFNAKPWDANPFDTMVQWTGSPRDFIKLDKLARAFGFQGKEGMDGSKVYAAWQAGRIQEIADYCRADVEMTRAVYKKMVEVFS